MSTTWTPSDATRLPYPAKSGHRLHFRHQTGSVTHDNSCQPDRSAMRGGQIGVFPVTPDLFDIGWRGMAQFRQ